MQNPSYSPLQSASFNKINEMMLRPSMGVENANGGDGNPYYAYFGSPTVNPGQAKLGYQGMYTGPDSYNGHSTFLSSRVLGLILQPGLSDLTSEEFGMPYRRSSSINHHWTEVIFDDPVLSRMPHLTAARTARSTVRKYSAVSDRWGLSIRTEYHFYQTAEGRLHWLRSLTQLQLGTISSIAFSVGAHWMMNGSRGNTLTKPMGSTARQSENDILFYTDMFGAFHTKSFAVDNIIDKGVEALDRKQITPNVVYFPRGCAALVRGAGEEKRSNALAGEKDASRARNSSLLAQNAFRGIPVKYTTPHSTPEEWITPRNPFFRQREVGDYLVSEDSHLVGIVDPNPKTQENPNGYTSDMRSIYAIDADRDKFMKISLYDQVANCLTIPESSHPDDSIQFLEDAEILRQFGVDIGYGRSVCDMHIQEYGPGERLRMANTLDQVSTQFVTEQWRSWVAGTASDAALIGDANDYGDRGYGTRYIYGLDEAEGKDPNAGRVLFAVNGAGDEDDEDDEDEMDPEAEKIERIGAFISKVRGALSKASIADERASVEGLVEGFNGVIAAIPSAEGQYAHAKYVSKAVKDGKLDKLIDGFKAYASSLSEPAQVSSSKRKTPVSPTTAAIASMSAKVNPKTDSVLVGSIKKRGRDDATPVLRMVAPEHLKGVGSLLHIGTLAPTTNISDARYVHGETSKDSLHPEVAASIGQLIVSKEATPGRRAIFDIIGDPAAKLGDIGREVEKLKAALSDAETTYAKTKANNYDDELGYTGDDDKQLEVEQILRELGATINETTAHIANLEEQGERYAAKIDAKSATGKKMVASAVAATKVRLSDGTMPSDDQYGNQVIATTTHPVNGPIWLNKLDLLKRVKANLPIPYTFLMLRLFATFVMGSGVLLRGGEQTGVVAISEETFTITNDGELREHVGTFGLYFAVLIIDTSAIMLLPDIYCSSYLGGMNTQFIRPDELITLRDSNMWKHRAVGGRNSLMCIGCPEKEKTFRTAIDVRGYHESQPQKFDIQTAHYSLAPLMDVIYNVQELKTDADGGNFDASVKRNTTAVQGHWESYNVRRSDWSTVTINQGCWGPNISQGMFRRIEAGMDILEPMDYEKRRLTNA